MLGELGPFKQRVDQPRAFAPVFGLHESFCLGLRRQNSQQIEIGAAEEASVVDDRRRIGPQRLELRIDVAVHVIVRLRFGPLEIRSRRHKRQMHRQVLIQVANHDRRLAGVLGRDQAIRRRLHGEIGRFVNGDARDVADGAIRECRRGGELRFEVGFEQHLRLGRDGDGRHRRRVLRILRGAGGDPLFQDLVFERILGEAFAALVGHGGGRFEEHQALIGLRGVDAPAEHVADQGVIVEVGILTAQGNLEARLAVGVAVTRAGVTTAFRQHGHDVIAEADRRLAGRQQAMRTRQQREGHPGFHCSIF